MSQIEDLILNRCPNGVEFRTIADVAKYVRGITYSKYDEQAEGPIRVLRSNNITLSSNTLNFDDVKRVSERVKVRKDQKLYTDDILVSAASGSKAHVGKVAFIAEDIDYAFGGFMAVLRTNGAICPRFLFHLLIGKSFSDYLGGALSTTTINNLNASIMGGFRIPVPPIEVQLAIVAILDAFSKSEAELETELQAELETRRKQYNHYRDSLIAAYNSSSIPMGKVGVFKRGRRFTKSDIVEDGIPSIHYGEIYTHYGVSADTALTHVRSDLYKQLCFAHHGDVVIATVGETVEDVAKAVAWLGSEPIAIHDDTAFFRSEENPKYISYAMQTADFHSQKNRHVARGKVKRLSGDGLSKILVPVPPRKDQDRIVGILDEFDALVNGLSAELPAELRTRRHQYEHYRNRLLTFQEAV
jgi:type I restriction enzyme, S subunit